MRFRFLLFLSVVFLGIGQIWGQTWTKLTNHSDVTSSGTYLIVDTDSETALTSANGSGTAPTAIDISSSLSSNLSTITGVMADNLQWKFETSGAGHIIRPVSDLSVALTATNTNNGVRITSSSSNVWTLGIVAGTYKGFQIPSVNGRYIGVYLAQDWRTYTSTTGNISTTNIEIYELEVSTDPTLSTSFSSLTGLGYMEGNASVSQSFSLSGMNLEPTSGNITVTAPANFQVSTDDVNFSNSLNISYSGGTLASTDVYVRLNGGLTLGNYNGDITISGGSANATVSVEGIVTEFSSICGEEDFENIPTNNPGTYQTRTWTGTNGGTWTATDARTDQSINGKAITIRNGVLTSPEFTSGVGSITMTTKLPFSDSAGNLVVKVNDIEVGTIPYSSVTTTSTISNVNIGGNIIVTVHSSGARVAIDDLEWTCYSSTPTPQISVTPSGNHDFGNQLVGSTSTPETFTIANTGTADLTIGTIALSGADADEFSVTQASSPVTQGNTTTFTVSFSPTSLGSKTATVTIPNNDENYTFTVTGNGSNSASSDIATNTSYSYTENILYANYQTPTITNTSNSVGVFQFAVRDGGGDNDGDDKPTTLTDIAFNYTGSANTIRAAALFIGNGKVADGAVSANGISFSGLNIVAPDNDSSPNITLRVSFTETVIDKEKLVFTVASATADASGSVFAQANAGGAFSDNNNNNNGNNRNRIEVVADRLAYATQPSGTSVNTNLAAFVIAGVDEFGNTDLDATNTITLTTSGTGMTASPSYTLSNGTVSISDVQFNTSQTGITLTATTTGLVSSNTVTSAPFDISDLATGTYRTTSNGTWPNNGTATWERLTASGWNAATPGVNTTDLLIIRHTITSNASFAATGGVGTKMIVENGGTFNGGHNCTFGELTIKQGGVFSVNDPAVTIKNTAPIGTLTVENGGKLILNSATLDNADGLWRGEENFYHESILEIKNWDWDASGTGNRRLVGSTNPISINSEGYYFGHIHFDATVGSDAFVFVQPTGNHKLCNDLIVKNGAASPNVILTVVNANIEIAGNVIAQQNTFSFGGVESSNLTHTVHGDIIGAGGIINLNQNSAAGATVFVDVKGNVDIPSGSQLISSDDGCKIIFSGQATTPQTISIAGTLGARVDFEVADEAEVHLINQHLNLANATNDFTVLTGGSLYFNYFNITGSGKFTQNTGGILKITDAQGVNTSGATGNVQTSSRTFSQAGHFHYVGNVTPQNTGNVFGPGSTTKRIVVNKDNATDIVNLGSGTGTTNELYIARGIFVETEAANINGSGALTIDDDGYYRTGVTSANTPRLTGTYTLANNSTVELNANADQSLTHGKNYGNLVFSNGGTTTSGTTPDIEGTITIKDDTTLNVGNNTFGKGITNLFMEDTSLFINGGSGVKPDAGGSYTLEPNTTIEFQGNSVTQIRTAPNYANVTVSGTNVTAGSTPVAGLTFQSGGTFTVKDGATFNVNNPDGFTGTSTSSIKNSGDLASIILEPNSTINYNHTGDQNITNVLVTSPANVHYQNLVISGSGTKTTATGNVIVNELTKVNAATLRIAETADNVNPNVITAKGGIQVTTGATALFENNAILMQDADAVNSGNIVMQRLVEDLDNDIVNQMDYVYWSSPVSPQGLQSFSPGSQYVLRYNETDDYFYYVNFGTEPNFILGKGYAFSAEVDTEHPVSSTGYDETYSFTGTPHNGDIEFNDLRKNSDTSQGFNLVGNPYPSNIHADDLFDANSSIYATVLFWTNSVDYTPTQQGSNYNGNNYSIYNKTGGNPATNYGNAFEIPNGIIKTGQGFMVQKKETGTSSLVFNNDMRITTNGTFYQKSGQVDKDRFWLTMTTYQGVVNTTLIGYIPGATNDFEQDYDAELMGGSDAVYTILGDKNLSIQGREYPFNTNEVIPLGVRFYQTGKFIIDIKDKEGIFDGSQRIYLKDKYLNKTHILSQSYYEFESHAGEYNDRFELFFRPSFSTSVVNPAWTIITQKQNDIFIYTSEDIIKDVEIVNLFGWPVYRQSNVNATELRIPSQSLGKQILVVKVKTESGKIETKKIINK